jgi:TPR repeat protein
MPTRQRKRTRTPLGEASEAPGTEDTAEADGEAGDSADAGASATDTPSSPRPPLLVLPKTQCASAVRARSCLSVRQGQTQDPAKAVEWMRKAADQELAVRTIWARLHS